MTENLNKNVPKLRFKGFTNAWEQRTLGDVLTNFEYGLNAPSKAYDGKNKYLRITDIDDTNHQFNFKNLTSPKIDLKNKNNFLLKEGDIVFARTGASVGKTYKYNKKDGKVYFAGYLIRAEPKKFIDHNFIFYTTLLDRYSNFVKVISIRSGQPGINSKEYKTYQVFIPKYNEQKTVSLLMEKIEKALTLQQRKYNLLRKIRQAFLQKIFASVHNKYLSLRFKQFENEWKQQRLRNLVTTEDGDWIEKQHIHKKGDYRIIQTGNIGIGQYLDKPKNKKFINQDDFEEIKAKEIFSGEILVCRLADPVGRTILVPSLKEKMVTVVDVAILKVKRNIIPNFLVTELNTNELLHTMAAYSSGSTRIRISRKNLEKIPIFVPTDFNEQKAISKLLKIMMRNIYLEQKEMKFRKKIKNFLLQNMFL